MDAIDIEGLKPLGKDNSDPDRCIYDAKTTNEIGDLKAKACERCGVIGSVYRHGKPAVTFWDSPMRGKHIQLRIAVQRFRCMECKETFPEKVPGIAGGRLMTARCVDYIRKQCLRDTWAHVAGHVGCDEGLIRRIAREYIDELNLTYKPYLPEWLGIDETKIAKKQRLVLTDVVNRRPIDMLEDRGKEYLEGWLRQFNGSNRLKGVSIDMWRPYFDVVRKLYPNIPIVVDKFHLLRKAGEGMDKVRVKQQKSLRPNIRRDWKRNKHQLHTRPHNLKEDQERELDYWLLNEPELAMAHHLKESFFEMYTYAHRRDAADHLDKWMLAVPKHMRTDFSALRSSVRNWREEILAYFDSDGITNGYTECFNGLAKIANRAGRGYTFDVLRARVLFGPKYPPKPEFAGFASERPLAEIVKRLMREQLNNRCSSCMGLFPNNQLYVVHIRGSKITLACEQCRERFNNSPLVSRG